MKKIIYGAAAITFMLFGCKESFKKSSEGLMYKIISDGKGEKVQNGNFFEIQFDQTYKAGNTDTVLADSRNFGNQIAQMDSLAIPPAYYKIFSQIRKGDSVIIKQSTDSIIKMGNAPAFLKKGQFIISHYKIVNLFTTKQQADSAAQAQYEIARQKDSIKAIAQLVIDDKIVAEYLTKNKITATKAPQGTYVEILAPGTGDAIDTGKVVKVNYTGKTLEGGKVFDSNTDPAFQHLEPIKVTMNAIAGMPGSVIKGWTDGLSLLKKGAKARFYVPSALAYGSRGAGKDIKPNENLIFDIEVVDVISAAQAKAEAEAVRKKYEDQQKKMMDSVKNSQKK
ncbi:FKBP-type peptidyl-prolyl cis-trans isomerase [Ferruginibacter lapsinanis]|uniref:FKBP-type peptidyl-prolyl cis-trans isomerase n=1 Tax=Ferruginibacter lapsinanis TaxID=563172 RepID=UPI001E41DF67|nr:FKBP-type peptidyl-prolyl cis-trans isomerase [Ferruginibacter lapsinanis]UEG49396.1 FKBP-type peptidyl-prolyl cis-trans isomerase [Ferruginibacter lapsinanis]